MRRKIIIIGAGASGLMAAVSAAEHGADVLVLEHMESAGKKLLLTGAGRCNYTNTDVDARHYHSLEETSALFSDAGHEGRSGCTAAEFVSGVLRSFSCEDCIGMFRGIGIEPGIKHYRFDETGYVYPEDKNAGDVLAALLKRTNELDVKIFYGIKLSSIRPAVDTGWEIRFHMPEHGHTVSHCERCSSVILAAGSNAYPDTGSDSSLYPFIKELGLQFQSFLPALCALYSKDGILKELKGMRKDGRATLIVSKDCAPSSEEATFIASESGEIQFNEHSISGIPVMQLSGTASAALKAGKKVFLQIDISAGDPFHHTFAVHRTAGFERSQCCAGGIALTEIDPRDMQARKHPGLYVCGELLDIHGDCGGYNLHFAWASGRIAGLSAAGHHKDLY